MPEDAYKIIQEKLHAYPLGAPPDPSFSRILRLIFTPMEAAVLAKMELKPMSAAIIAGFTGKSEAEIKEMLENLANQGLVFSRKKNDDVLYSLLPPLPGIFEFPFMKKDPGPDSDQLSKLWNQYFQNALGPYMHDERGPATLRVLTVEREIPRSIEIMPFETVSDIIDNAHLLALAQCPCRQATRNCDAPLDVCIILNSMADFLTDRNIAKKISTDEAHDALHRAEDAGLIHTTNNSKKSMPFVCNCCACCCFMLRGVSELSLPGAIATSKYQAKVDSDNCDACGLCEPKCRFSAISVSDSAEVARERCYGCGLCVRECPNDSIMLIPRPDYIHPPETGADLLQQLAKARTTEVNAE